MLRGRLDVVRQFTTLAANTQGLACRFDARSPDIALNQIMKAAIRSLSRISRSAGNQRLLRELDFAYDDVADVPIKSLSWNAAVIDRTNARWRELLNLARLLLAHQFQDSSMGASSGFSLLFEMNTLFEEFVARMLRRGLAGTDLSMRVQGGRRFCLEAADDGEQRFMTRPDILVERDGEVVLVIDTKWKRLSGRLDDPKQGVSQGDVYQMMAYGQVYQCSRLLLLYPHHGGLERSEGLQSQNRIRGGKSALATATLDLSVDAGIARRLRELVVCEADKGKGGVIAEVISAQITESVPDAESATLSVSLAPPTDALLRCSLRVLAMVAELHKVGYQRLRIAPGMSPSGGAWRCSIATADNIQANGWEPVSWGEVAVRYSSADAELYFGWTDAPGKSARQLAQMFIERFPEVAAKGAGRDRAYAGWFIGMLGAAENGQLPAFFADYELDFLKCEMPPPPHIPTQRIA